MKHAVSFLRVVLGLALWVPVGCQAVNIFEEETHASEDAALADAAMGADGPPSRPDGPPPTSCDQGCDDFANACNRGVCDEATDLCKSEPTNEGMTCEQGTECGTFGSCDNADVCALAGEKQRLCSDYACHSGECLPVERKESEPCVRNTNDTACAETRCGEWSACAYEAGTCDNSGRRTRVCTPMICKDGGCVAGTPHEEADPSGCDRNTDATACDAPNCGAYGACAYDAGICDNSGVRSRACTPRVCQTGTCAEGAPYTDSDTTGCARDTRGNECAKTVCGEYGACTYGSDCVNNGERSRTCTPQVCENEQCVGSTPYHEPITDGCNRNTSGRPCGEDSCSDWGACQYADPCSESGTQSRTCQAQLCSSGKCALGTAWTESGACTRSTEGNTCGTTRCCLPVSGGVKCFDFNYTCQGGACDTSGC